MKKLLVHVLVLGAVVAIAGCNKSGPVEVPFNSSEYSFTFRVQNAAGEATALRWQVFLDGRPVSPVLGDGRPAVAFEARGAVPELAAGSHVMTLRILEQTASPSEYRVTSADAAWLVFERGSVMPRWVSHWPALAPVSVPTGGELSISFAF